MTSTTGAESDEALEAGEVSDPEDVPHVAVEVGRDVVGEPDVDRNIALPRCWIASLQRDIEPAAPSEPVGGKLVEPEWQQVQERRPPRQRLRDGL